MNLKRRLDRLEGGKQATLTVFVTQYDAECGTPEIARAVVVSRQGRTSSLERAAGETEAAFKARVASL